MSVTIANQMENHRGVAWEVTGDGATTSFTVTHHSFRKANHTVQVTGSLVGTSKDRGSGKGGLQAEMGGTAIAITSASLAPTTGVITVQTTSAIGNGAKGYFVAVFDQTTI